MNPLLAAIPFVVCLPQDSYVDRSSGRPIIKKKRVHDPYSGNVDRSTGRPMVYGNVPLVNRKVRKDAGDK